MEWISVETKLPKSQEIVLFVNPYTDYIMFGYRDDNIWYDLSHGDYDARHSLEVGVTHWAPLPEPPEES